MNDFILKYGSSKDACLKSQIFKNTFDVYMSIKDGEILCNENSLLNSNSRVSVSSQDDFTCISNSRILNANRLCSRNNFEKCNDSNLIYNLYKLKGNDFVKYIEGPFSVIIINHNKNALHAFSDHFSSKPIFFHKNDGDIFFSNSINLLKKITDNNEIDEEILLDYLITGAPRSQRTIYRDIDIIPLNSHILIDENGFSIKKYRNFKAKIIKDSLNVIKETMKKVMFQVVDDELSRTNREIAFTLSGGLDSSSLLCTANKINLKKKKYKLSSHSAYFKDLRDSQRKITDESVYIKDVIKNTEVESFDYNFSNKGSLNIIDMLSDTEEPALGPNLYINFRILDELKIKKIGTLYEGIGGDSAISHGHGHFYNLGRELKLITLFDEYKKFCLNKKIKFSYIRCIKNFVVKPRIPEKILRKMYNINKYRNDYFNVNNFLKNKYHIDVGRRYEEVHGYHPALASSFKYNPYFYEELSTNDLFEPYASRVSYHIGKKFGVEIIFPFNDIRIREYCMNIPYNLKMHNGIDRYYFRESMEKIIPKSIKNRVWKSDISPIFFNEMKELTLEQFNDFIFKNNKYFEKFLDKDKVNQMFKKFKHAGDQQFATTLYKYIYLSMWLKKNIF